MATLTLAPRILDFLLQCKSQFLVFVLGAWVVHLLYIRYGSPLSKYPGPVLASVTPLWQVWASSTATQHQVYMKLHKKYGPVVRMGPNDVSLASPFAAAEILKPGKGFHKTDFYRVFLPPPTVDLFTETRESVHGGQKRIIAPLYGINAVQEHKEQFEALLDKFFSKIDSFAAQNQSCDLGTWLHYLTFDNLGEFAFAQSFGFLDAGKDLGNTMSTITQLVYENAMVGHVPVFEDWIRQNPLYKHLPQKNMDFLVNTALGALDRYSAQKSESGQSCLLESLLNAQKDRPDKITTSDVLATSMGAIAAGADSTTSTMHSFIWQVLANPEIHEKLVAELATASLSETVQFHEAQNLRYFQACLKECWRVQPPFSANILRKIPFGGAELDGVYLPADTKVGVNAWVVHRNVEVFGCDSDVFRPERWIEASDEQVKRMERLMIHFGGGSHICIGKNLATYELNIILPSLFRRYKIRLENPTRPLAHSTGLFLNQSGLIVFPERR